MSQNMELDEEGLEAALTAKPFGAASVRNFIGAGALDDEIRAVMSAAIRAYLTATRPDAGDLVSRLRVHLYEHWLVSVECDHEAKTDTATCSCSQWRDVPHPSVGGAVKAWIDHVFSADFISRLSTAPAGDVVLVPRELDRKKLEALAALWGYTIEETAGSYAVLIDLLAPTPSPQTSPATEGEPDGWQHRIYYEDTANWSEWRDGKWHRKNTLDNKFEERPLFANPPPAKAGEGEYRPTLLRNEAAGFTEFVTEDVPAITGHMFAANVEPIVRMSGPRGEVIGYRIYDPRTP